MRTLTTILSLSLALIGASTPAAAGTNILGWRLWNPLVDTESETGSVDPATVDRKVAMAENGYTLVSSTVSHGLSIELWSPTSDTISKRSPLLPESLPGAKRGRHGVPIKREAAPPPSELRRRDSATTTPELEKRDTIDIQGRTCTTDCRFQAWTKADTNDCISAYQKLYSIPGIFTLRTGEALSATSDQKKCSIWTVNHSPYNITYDYWDAAGTGQWLNGDCLISQAATIGVCLYDGIGTNVTNGVYTSVCYPTFMTG